jgi:hypothetical protein
MPVLLEGSCRCGAVHFSAASNTPDPYQRCYCTICRNTDGGGGYAINIMALSSTLNIRGETSIGIFHAPIVADDGSCTSGSAERRFCTGCGTALWLFSPEYPDWIYPFASCIDTALPTPPSKVHLMLKFKAGWVAPDVVPGDLVFDGYPDESIEDWHKARGRWVD